MGVPKSEATRPGPRKRGRPPKATQSNALSVRGSEEWRGWLAEFAEARRTTPTGVIDQALAALAKADKFKAPPPRI